MAKVKVSILMNCYNSQEFLQEAIESIMSQSYQNFEIVFIDNCSTDNSKAIATSVGGSKLKYICTPELMPLYAARKFALDYIDGEYLCFLDCDDYWLSDKLEQQIYAMETKSADFIYTNAKLHLVESSFVKKTFGLIYIFILKFFNAFKTDGFVKRKSVIKNYSIIMQSVMLRTSLIKGIKFNEKLNLLGDLDFFFRYLFINEINPYYLRKLSTVYRLHSGQLTKQSSWRWYVESRYLERFSLNEVLSKKYLELYNFYFTNMYKSNFLLDSGSKLSAMKIKLALVPYGIKYTSHFLKTCILILIR